MQFSLLLHRWARLGFLAFLASSGIAAVTITKNTLLPAGDTSLDGQDVIVDAVTLSVGGAHTFASLQLVNGGVLTHEPAPGGEADSAIRLTVTGGATVDAASRIDATGRGYAEAGSPGAGVKGSYAGGGGGHGGRGHASAGIPSGAGGAAFGSITAPNEWGGPGGNSDSTSARVPGGGLIHLEVGGTLTVAGAVRADGAGAWINNQGGGAGGTVYLKAGTLAGGGTISANGGPGEWVDGGGGAGGRIALFFAANQFTGSVSAAGAGGAGVGGAGTVYLKPGEAAGELRIANGARGEWTPIASPVAFDVVLDGLAVVYPTAPLTLGSLAVNGNALLTHATGSTGLVVSASGNVTVAPDAAINVDGRGYPVDGDRGPGTGVLGRWAGSGAGHGGLGGWSTTGYGGGPNYGSVLQPTTLGSQGGDSDSGPGAAGGGAIRLAVGGTLNVQGRLSANGADSPVNNAGGGSGGSIWITAGTLSGSGPILANGGAGEWVDGGGGSGGRIALYLGDDLHAGVVTAYGGGGSQKGGAGTVYTKRSADAVGDLVVDNGGTWGNYTPITTPEAFRLTIAGRAHCYPEAALTAARLTIPGEAILTHLTGQSNVTLHVTGDATIATDGQISADGRGYPIGEDPGPGTGLRNSWAGSGGGYGGLGGVSTTGASGGVQYGSLLQPTALGSQGGSADGGPGTAGGGAIRLMVDGKLTVDGRVSANGASSPPNNAGGGSGGSVWLTVGSLAGAGTISANGGPGEWVDGGGGSGGRIALYYGVNDFAGAIIAYGGGGHQRGGAGTIYARKTGSAFGQVLVHNGGSWGNYTPLTSPEAFQLVLAEMAQVYPIQPLTLRDLEVRANTVLTHLTGQNRCDVTVLNDAFIAEGGRIDADGRGYPIGDDRGPGAGALAGWCGSGGGHGGKGGKGACGAEGGTPYGSVTEPLELGSAGGTSSSGPGPAGGGVIRLNVSNVLTVDGRVTANGINATVNDTGGGAGGSLDLSARTIAGKGSILADGGNGEWVDGGGGGGGRIALHASTISFSGELFARGGGGAQRGGAGSIYRQILGQEGGDLVLDNGGNGGVLTPFDVPAHTRLTLRGGAAFYPTGPLNVVSLNLEPGATLTHINGQHGLAVNVEQDLTVAANAAIDVNGRGYPVGDDPGPGAGANGPFGSGGAYGGNGGVAHPGNVAGGLAYGSVLEPIDLGSSGGGADGQARSPGGGAVRLVVGGTFTLEGSLTANGTSAWYNNQGGAAGGSIWITAAKLAGAGSLTANGGAGEWVDGGSGSGGRIALYLGTHDFTGTVTARGGAGGRQTGGAGTIYTRFDGEPVGEVLVENGGSWGAFTPMSSPEIFHLKVASQAQVYGQTPLLLQSLEVGVNAVLTHLKGDGGVNTVVLGDTLIAGRINADGLGYPIGGDPGPGAGGSGSWAGGGAGHGGDGYVSASGAPGGLAYGSLLKPSTPGSQGGAGDSGAGTDGGGVVRLIVGGKLTVDGSITANALGSPVNNAGGGSGGSVFLSARALAGAGEIRAEGGPGEWVDGGSGAGGRIAVYRNEDTFSGIITANGAGGARPGGAGTIHKDVMPGLAWLAPGEAWLNGETPVEVAVFLSGTGPFTVEFSAWRNGIAAPIGTATGTLTAKTRWDTTRVADGSYELRAVARDAGGSVLGEERRAVSVNNAVVWHDGVVGAADSWGPGKVHVVRRELTIAGGQTLTLEPGTIVKLMPGGHLTLVGTGKLVALGTATQPITLTSFLDDSVGGDSNLDGDSSRPTPGSWRLSVGTSATLEVNDQTRLRYHSRSYGGTLAGSETWTADSLREITAMVTVPAGVTLTLDAGAIVKFGSGLGIDVLAGGKLITRGTVAQPVVFTSLRDDGWGGDSNQDGTRSRPAAGDWRSLRFESGAEGDLNHTRVLYGGNSVGNPWGAGGVIEPLGGPFVARNCVIADSLKDGAFAYGTTRFENCVVLRCDRGLTAVGEMTVLNCTLEGNKIGLLEHVGHLIVQNTIVSGSIVAGIEHDLGGYTPSVRYCNVWNPNATRGNYSGTADVTGSAGNLSAAPRYRDAAADNYRLYYASPGIDAADGALAPETDLAGVGRYDDPRTGNTGTAAANGAIPDIGAFEFAENAPSNLDLVVLGVSGPAELSAGATVHVEWTVVNRGAEAFSGPWHDGLFLRNTATGERLSVAEVLVGRGATLAPGQSYLASADVRVPGGVAGSYSWQVVGNSRGDIFEGANAANNASEAGLPSSLTLPVIPLDGPAVSSAFQTQEELNWFQCLAPAGKDVRFDLDLLAPQGVTEVYVGKGFVPTPERYSARQREWAAADTSAVVSGSGDPTGPGATNVFYVLAVGRVLWSTPQPFKLGAVSAAFALESAIPSTVGNAGLVTLEIRGAALTPDTRFTVSSGANRRVAVRQSARESGRIFATFDLAGFPAGQADLVAEAGGLQVVLPKAITIFEGGTPDFYATLSGPGTTRAGRFMTWFVTYGNRGLVDMRLPLLRFNAPGATEIQLYESTLNWASSFTFWGLNPEVLLPTLGPGQEVTFEVRVKAMNPGTITVEMVPGESFAEDPTSFDWASIPPVAGADAAAWAAMVNGLNDRLGATIGDYHALLEQDLADFAASPLRYTYLANINGRWLLGDERPGIATSAPLIIVPEDYVEPTATAARDATLQGPKAGDGIRKTWWLVVTLEDYEYRNGDKEGDLPGCAVDAQDLHEYATKDLRTPREQYLWAHDTPDDGKRVTRSTLLNGIKSLKGKVDADDNLVIVYSGHGGRKPSGTPYLVFNGDNASPVAFTQAIDEVGAGTTYFVNNSCHSEGFNELVQPTHTKFVGLAATTKERVAWSDNGSGGEMISKLKSQLRKCRSLGLSFEVTTDVITKTYETQANEKHRQKPVLTNPTGASLDGKPWNDPSGFEQRIANVFRSAPFSGTVASGTFTIVGSVDPNDKYALAGAGPEHWIHTDQVLPFEVVFENKPTAAAPAQEVLVTDDLDPNLDWSTFELKAIEFNDARLEVPPGLQRYNATTRVSTDTNAVTVEVSFDPTTGRITWLMRSRDANTGDLPEDPFAGFLPPNDASHRGEGSLTYTIRPKLGLADGTRIKNKATIVFDPTYGANPPILTPIVTNTVDSVAPGSAVAPLPSEVSGSVEVTWSGQDASGGSGIASYDVYVAKDAGAYQLWQIATSAVRATFTGQPGSTYRFYSIARDAAGNTETAPATADATTTFAGGSTFENWIASQGVPTGARGPGDDPDQDGVPNFAEYAYALNPMSKDSQLAKPKFGTVQVGGTTYLAITYRRPKADPSDVQYRVTQSGVVRPWANAASVTSVGAPVDQGTYVEVTVRSTEPISAKRESYLRLEVVRP